MKKPEDKINTNTESLRRKAEEILENNTAVPIMPDTEAGMLKLIHELQVHQVELEMQGEELALARTEAIQDAEKYAELYDFSPSGLFTLNREGIIQELNLTGAGLLGKERKALLNKRFGFFVASESRHVFNVFIEKVFSSGKREICELLLSADGFMQRNVLLSCLLVGEQCQLTVVDITGQRDAENALGLSEEKYLSLQKDVESISRESEQKYRNLVSDMPVGMLLQGPQSEMLLSNSKALELLGITEEQLLGKTSFDPDWNVIHEDGTPFPGHTHPVPQAIATLSPAHDVIMGVYRPAHADRIWLQVSAEPELNKDGTIKQVICTFIDISARKKAEEELKNSEQKYHSLYENMIEGAALHEILYNQQGMPEDYRIVEVNPAYESQLGINKADILGKTGREAYGVEDPPFFEIYSRVARSGNPESFETYFAPLEKYFSISAYSPYKGSFATVFQDISKRRKAEDALQKSNAYLENLLNYANAPIIVWDPRFCITRFNRAFEFLTGYTEAEVLGKSLEMLFPLAQVTASMALIQNTLEGDRLETAEIEIQHRDQSVRILLWNSATLFSSDGRTPLATIAQGQEISRRKAAEKEVIHKNEELLKMIAEKDKFFSILAHDLRSPFNGFLGLTRIMAEDLPNLTMDEIRGFALNMQNSAKNLFRLLENLLEWSQLQLSSNSFNPRLINLPEAVRESMATVMDYAANKGIEISNYIQENTQVFADDFMLQTMIRNLVTNAVKFSQRGGKVSISALPRAGNYIEIRIQDSGIGMNTQILDNLFRIDMQTNRKGTEGEPSTGLGLLLCSEIVGKHGGKIWARSEEGKGSIFHFTLPLDPVMAADRSNESDINYRYAMQVKDLKILVVDDDDISRLLISKAVKIYSNEVLKVESGARAVEACRNNPGLDLVMMDIKMPGMDGYEATRRIRQFNDKVVIIAQTAFGETENREIAILAGCNDYITKPINIALLKKLMQHHFRGINS
ncbi:MAG: PAS domain S-box protein [Bacteroidota bacterium]